MNQTIPPKIFSNNGDYKIPPFLSNREHFSLDLPKLTPRYVLDKPLGHFGVSTPEIKLKI